MIDLDENTLHNLIISNKEIQQSLLNILDIDSDYEFISEDQYPNGLYADFTIKNGTIVKAILELKGDNIGVSDFVRGIGQVLQYQHFANEKMSLKSYEFQDTTAVLMFPSSIIKNRNFNIGIFDYPKDSKILEINENNYNIREITREELVKLGKAVKDNLAAISQYYIRDNRLFELYLCLKFLQIRKMQGYLVMDRKEIEMNFLRNLETPNNKNWRNAFISLSSLNLIDRNNCPTITGARYADMSFEKFAYEMYKSYLSPYIDLMTQVLLEFGQINDIVFAPYNEISKKVSRHYNNKKVLYFTESDNRYLSSWLNIMRDDFGSVLFEPRKNCRSVRYNLSELNELAIQKNIKKNSIAYKYLERFNNLFTSKEIIT